MVSLFAVNFVGAMVFLFILWKRLKEDYSSSIVFTIGFSVIITILVLAGVAKLFVPVWWFWLISLGIAFVVSVSILHYKLKVFETIDASFASLVPWLALLFLLHSIMAKNPYSLGAFAVTALVYFLYIFFNANYKKFSWYISGKVGFSGLMALGVLFLIRGLSSLFLPDVLSFVGSLESAISGVVSIGSFLGVFYLARKVE